MQVLPIDVTGLIGAFMGTLIVLIPVAGLTARFALKPIVEAIVRVRESQVHNREMQLLERRIALLEQQQETLEYHVDQLVGGQEDEHRIPSQLLEDVSRRSG